MPLFKLIRVQVYNNNYHNNYSLVILICLQPFCKPHLYFILHTSEMFKHATCHKTDWLQLTVAHCDSPFYIHMSSVCRTFFKVEGSWSRLLENSTAKACICAFSYLSVPHAYCYWFIWKVFDVFVYTLTFVAFVAFYLFHAHDLCFCRRY